MFCVFPIAHKLAQTPSSTCFMVENMILRYPIAPVSGLLELIASTVTDIVLSITQVSAQTFCKTPQRCFMINALHLDCRQLSYISKLLQGQTLTWLDIGHVAVSKTSS